MAIALNKYAIRCEKAAIADGKIKPTSPAQTFLYDISRKWRKLLSSTKYHSEESDDWSEREEAAAEVVLSAVMYLRRIGCKDIDRLLKDIIERRFEL